MDRCRRHPNLAKFIGCYEFKNPHARCGVCVVQVLQLWEGGSLLEKVMGLISRGEWNETYAAQAFSQLLCGARAMHEADGTGAFIHCDVKLDNMFVADETRDSMVLLGDFGETRFIPRSDDNPHSEYKMTRFVGTGTYASPEQLIPDASGMHTYSPAADMWSLGVTLYCMLCQAFPFPRDPGRDQTERVRTCKYYAMPGTVQADARDLIVRLLSVDPRERPTASEALEHPWIKRATMGGVHIARDEFYLPTSGVGGALIADIAHTATMLSTGGSDASSKQSTIVSELHGGLTASQLKHLLERIREVTGTSDVTKAELNEKQFDGIMESLDIKGLVPGRLFAAFDVDKSGSISVKEFTAGIARITEPSEDRARLVFSLYDQDGDGTISLGELTDVLRASVTSDAKLEEVKIHRLVNLLAAMDVEKSGHVTIEQYLEAVKRDPFLAKLMLQPNLHFQRFVAVGDGASSSASAGWDVKAVKHALEA
jgi:calcium-dependent protein kinase